MKKIILGFILSFSAVAFVGCDMNDPNADKFASDPEAGWVQFTQSGTVTRLAGCDEITLPITTSAPINDTDLEVFYTITDIDGSTANLETYARIPAGSRTGEFVISNPEALTSGVEFTLTLTSTSRNNVTVGFPDTAAQTLTVRVVPGNERFVATYNTVENSFEGEFNYETTITQGDEPNELIITNVYGVDTDSQTSVFVNADGTLSFPAFEDNFLYTATGGIQRFVEGLSGTADACSGEIVINFNLRSGPTSTSTGPYNIVLTRQ